MVNLVIHLFIIGIISQSCAELVTKLDRILENDIAPRLKDTDDIPIYRNQNTPKVPSTFSNSPYPDILTDGVAKFPIPFHVSIQMNNNNQYEHLCAGTIIDDSFVLTAGHCFIQTRNPNRLSVVAGSNKLSINTGQRFKVVKIIVNDHYQPLQGYDIGLLKVSPKFVLNGINIDKVNFNFTDTIRNQTDTFLIGWGRVNMSLTQNLEIVSFTTIDRNLCKRRGFKFITKTELCAISYKGRGACDGDSGGPLVSADLKTQLGILSYGREICATNRIYAFTYIKPLVKWILNQLKRFR